ncbi:hypothetical protein SPRG_20413 [Saprolegnia parasitica CBS 223.65]|uniref:Uncharacterized protein n=1 Tax=Saprolegnia parasitica (strain CBS 223.65) TaxID=695850 RepID=A0A067CA06_SAPPC|nr:hypothetical protein SPRG_20413 [Saprolegnia parasitica CBS 223.65]KDO27318.1 hypothetical protein SPRG_20413 [Saprolegnia parasitica CBS 223.65]|eukprot:XP_012202115.1 hypothetical protein SPRG_20413 [Saprolegnia parasitica CBS 223.65]
MEGSSTTTGGRSHLVSVFNLHKARHAALDVVVCVRPAPPWQRSPPSRAPKPSVDRSRRRVRVVHSNRRGQGHCRRHERRLGRPHDCPSHRHAVLSRLWSLFSATADYYH